MESCSIDHVIVAVGDLDEAAVRFRDEHGLESVAGGRHTGHGTANRIIPLAGAYLELMAVVDENEAAVSPLGSRMLEWTSDRDRPVALCLRTVDVVSVADRLGLEPLGMSRDKPDGTRLHWTLAGMEHALGPERLPFFIEWHVAPGDHPAESTLGHPGGAACFGSIRLTGDAVRLRAWLGEAASLVEIGEGTPGIEYADVIVGGERIRIA